MDIWRFHYNSVLSKNKKIGKRNDDFKDDLKGTEGKVAEGEVLYFFFFTSLGRRRAVWRVMSCNMCKRQQKTTTTTHKSNRVKTT